MTKALDRDTARPRARTLMAVAAIGLATVAAMLTAPAAQAGGGNLPTPREFVVEQVKKPIRCAEAAELAGWRDSDLVIATAIALAESGCDPKAVGTNPPSGSCPSGSRDRGSWQINDCYHPDVTDACAFKMQCNADAAFQIYLDRDSTFQPWTTYNTRAFQYFLNESRKAVKRLTGENIVVGVVTTDGGPLTIRERHTTESPAVGSLPYQAVITVQCQARGERVYSSVFGYYTRLWDRLAPQQWVSDGYVYTDNEGRVASLC